MRQGADTAGRRYDGATQDEWKLLCPECGAPILAVGSRIFCPREKRYWEKEREVYPLLSEARRRKHDHFIEVYRFVRRREGWEGDGRYYLDLPFRDRSGRHGEIWKIRARSYRWALREIERHFGRAPLRVLEVGAGNCWFSSRLVRLGHRVLATDILLDERDGLGAFDIYRHRLPFGLERVQADMEDLPLSDGQFDLVAANGAIHYARDLRRVAAEACRLLRPGGLFLVLDSPTYRRAQDGRTMIEQRAREHRERHGIFAKPEEHSGFLVLSRFVALLEKQGFQVRQRRMFDGFGRSLRRGLSLWMGWSAPAEFVVFAARKGAGE